MSTKQFMSGPYSFGLGGDAPEEEKIVKVGGKPLPHYLKYISVHCQDYCIILGRGGYINKAVYLATVLENEYGFSIRHVQISREVKSGALLASISIVVVCGGKKKDR